MVAPTITETVNSPEYITSELGSLSRDVAVIASGGADLLAGTVLGKITASGKFKILAPAASDGTEVASAILFERANVSGGVDLKRTVHVRIMEANGLCLIWPAGITTPQQNTAIAQLATKFIIVRT